MRSVAAVAVAGFSAFATSFPAAVPGISVISVISVARADAGISPTEAARLISAARVVQDIRASIPQREWDRARCVAVFPDLQKTAFMPGGAYGSGLMSCHSADRWSAPVFVQLAKGNWRFQAGAGRVDVVLLVMSELGVQRLLENNVNLGADAEVVSYARAGDAFAGVNLTGGVLRPDRDANRTVYGGRATTRTILASREISAPTQADAFLKALTAASSGGTITAAARNTTGPVQPRLDPSWPASTASTAARGANEPDLKARVADMQQTLDRLLADAAQLPVGTSGGMAASGATLTVDRARLFQLRQQLGALMAALER